LQFELWHAALLGLVEGITEFLPVSSTGHLIVTSQLIGLGGAEHKDAIDAFEVIIQGGAILAVVGLYWPRFVQMLQGLLGRDPAGLRLLTNLVIAFVPAAVIGLAVHKMIKQHLFYVVPVAAAFIVGAIYMAVLDRWKKAKTEPGKEVDQLTPRDAALIGLLQCVSMWPGTSRSMMTITGGYIVGLRAGAAAEFSFLLGVPTLLAAAGLDLFKDLWHAHKTGEATLFAKLGAGPTILGLVIAAVLCRGRREMAGGLPESARAYALCGVSRGVRGSAAGSGCSRCDPYCTGASDNQAGGDSAFADSCHEPGPVIRVRAGP
jgi:undecaprenyl-diphosphatase